VFARRRGLGERLLLGLGAGLLLFGHEAFECDTCSVLLGLLLGGAFGFGEGAGASVAIGNADFDAEELLMIGAALSGEHVLGLACSSGLKVFLESGLVVANGSGEGVAGAQGSA
jgi:hypothetical protein